MDKFSESLQIEYADKGIIVQVKSSFSVLNSYQNFDKRQTLIKCSPSWQQCFFSESFCFFGFFLFFHNLPLHFSNGPSLKCYQT